MAKKIVETTHPGLVNPELSSSKTTAKSPESQTTQSFKTHIPEPHWQRVISVLVVLIAVCFWLMFLFHQK